MILQKSYKGRTITLANGFAANDPESTSLLWQKVLERVAPSGALFALVNTREDRGDRSRQMAEVVHTWQAPNNFLLIGTGTDVFLKHVDPSIKALCLDHPEITLEPLLETIISLTDEKEILLIGVCNIANIGFALLHYFFEEEEV
jgi:hypothetical protein